MAQAGNLIAVRSARATDFTAAIVQNAATTATLRVPANLKGPARARVRNIVIISKENLAWELQFFASATFQQPGNIDNDSFLGYWAFAAADGVRATINAPANYFCYYIDGLDIPIESFDDDGSLHVALVNRSAAAKTVGAAGELIVRIGLETTLGW